ncbi:MAG: PKD domain-containing protein [Planctomycetota bacterium]
MKKRSNIFMLFVIVLALGSLLVHGCKKKDKEETIPVPFAEFTITPITEISGYAPHTVHFTDESTGDITSYSWDFDNDGTEDSTEQNPVYIYTTPGGYSVSLTVTGPGGSNKESKINYITVDELITPAAEFSASVTDGVVPLTVNFIDESTGDITSYEWDFDNDGTVDSTEQNPSYTYETMGLFSVKLTATGPGGIDEIIEEQYISVTAASTYSIYVDAENGDNNNDGSNWRDAVQTIRKSLNLAGDFGWTIYVADGTYSGDGNRGLSFEGKSIHLQSVNGYLLCTIDCGNSALAFSFYNGETAEAIVEGFTIKNGRAASSGGAIYCQTSDPTIKNCKIKDSNAGEFGGAIYCCMQADPTIINCIIESNDADYGGGIACNQSYGTVINCTIINNSAYWYGAGIYCESASPVITGCLIADNTGPQSGGGVCCYDFIGTPVFTNCTIVNNSADYGGGVSCEWNAAVELNNTIIWGNQATISGNQIRMDYGSSGTLNNCDYSNGDFDVTLSYFSTINSCINTDPLFVNSNNNYRLQAYSPCIDAGDDSYLIEELDTDLDNNTRISGDVVDIGAYEYQQ